MRSDFSSNNDVKEQFYFSVLKKCVDIIILHTTVYTIVPVELKAGEHQELQPVLLQVHHTLFMVGCWPLSGCTCLAIQ